MPVAAHTATELPEALSCSIAIFIT